METNKPKHGTEHSQSTESDEELLNTLNDTYDKCGADVYMMSDVYMRGFEDGIDRAKVENSKHNLESSCNTVQDAFDWLKKEGYSKNDFTEFDGDVDVKEICEAMTQFASQPKPQIPSEKEKALDVEGIIRKYLDRHGYDGLYSDFCGCETTDLVPCDNNPMRCKPGYMHIGKATDEHDFYIKSKPLTKK